jgi:hypothetical protein
MFDCFSGPSHRGIAILPLTAYGTKRLSLGHATRFLALVS